LDELAKKELEVETIEELFTKKGINLGKQQ